MLDCCDLKASVHGQHLSFPTQPLRHTHLAVPVSNEPAAIMSVAGFDVGNCTSCVALARKRGVDVLMNSESKRETPALVSYGEKQRFIGVNGAAKLLMNVKNTVSEVKRLLGRKFSDPDVQKDLKNMMYEIEEGPDGGVLVNVQYLGERRKLTPEQVMASLLKDLKRIAEEDQGSAVTDCVLSVPAYYSEAERLAMLSSASLAGLKCLRLMNEPTATALAYGIFKTDLPEEQSIDVAFVDVGNSAMQVRALSCSPCFACPRRLKRLVPFRCSRLPRRHALCRAQCALLHTILQSCVNDESKGGVSGLVLVRSSPAALRQHHGHRIARMRPSTCLAMQSDTIAHACAQCSGPLFWSTPGQHHHHPKHS